MSEQSSMADAERLLRELEQELVARIDGMEDSTNAPKMDSSVGRLTYIDAYQSQQLSLHAKRKLSVQLSNVRSALERVKSGTYGRCTECGAEIPAERLEIAPEVPFCVTCKQRLGR
ncbi:MAG: TraR/DksA C4-type zinc finger protein [Planctomycetaceae bacterium]